MLASKVKGNRQVSIAEVRPAELSEPQWEATAALVSDLNLEFDPDRPSITSERLREYWSTDSPKTSFTRWIAWEDGSPIGLASYTTYNTEANQHMADVWNLGVHKERRRQGIASRFLVCVADKAQSDRRTLLFFSTSQLIPAGETFVRRLGARHVYTEVKRRLDLDGVQRDQLSRWLEESPRRAGKVRLEFWDGSFPERDKEEVARLLNSIDNDMPRMDATMEDSEYTPEQVWGDRQRAVQAGSCFWTYVARDPPTGMLVGFSEVSWWPEILEQAGHVFQGDTGVIRDYRRRGIGRWLKVALIDRILRELPKARFITTGSAEVNEPMHSLNRSLGFRVQNTFKGWEVETTNLMNYLGHARK